MKTFILIFLILTSTANAQVVKTYISVSPTKEKHFEEKEDYYSNTAVFEFNIKDYYLFNYCMISFYPSDPQRHILISSNKVAAYTGLKYEYYEDASKTDSTGFVILTVLTDNLPKLAIIVYYDGIAGGELILSDVRIELYGNKF